MADAADIMADTADILARCRRKVDTSSAEAGRNSAAANGERIEIGVAANGAAVAGIGTPIRAGAFLTRLTTAIILMGITPRTGTDLVIPTTGVGTHIGAGAILTGTILRIGTFMTTAPYQGSDSFTPNPSVILF
jgi:hypothetical protein